MEILLFTAAGIALYFVSDWILLRIEDYLGRRLEYRTLVFFAIILVLSITSFNVMQSVLTGMATTDSDPGNTAVERSAE